MKQLKTGKMLWDTIEKAARKMNNVNEDFVLTMVDLGHPNNLDLGECEYRLNNKITNDFRRGFVTYDPYI